MYNGNGYTSGRRIAPIYLYIGIGLLVLLAIWILSSFIRAGVEGYFTLAAGALLLLGNVRDLIAPSYSGRSNVALFNTLLGGSLVLFFLGRGGFPPLGMIWYVPAVLLLLASVPAMIGRAGFYTPYLGMARDAAGNARRAIGAMIAR